MLWKISKTRNKPCRMKVKNTVAFRKKVFSTKTELQKFCADYRWCPIINLFLKSHFMSLNKCRNIPTYILKKPKSCVFTNEF